MQVLCAKFVSLPIHKSVPIWHLVHPNGGSPLCIFTSLTVTQRARFISEMEPRRARGDQHFNSLEVHCDFVKYVCILTNCLWMLWTNGTMNVPCRLLVIVFSSLKMSQKHLRKCLFTCVISCYCAKQQMSICKLPFRCLDIIYMANICTD